MQLFISTLDLSCLVKLAAIASKDDSRNYLKTVYLEFLEGNKVLATATDGYKLGQYELDIEHNLAGTGKLICATTILKLIKPMLAMERKNKIPMPMLICDNEIRFGAVGVKIIDREYIKYNQAIPTKEAKCSFSINAKYLYEVSKSIGSDILTLEFVEQDAPIRIKSSMVSKIKNWLIMPVR